LASKYGLEKSSTRARSPVIVIAAIATSQTSVLRESPEVMESKSTSSTSSSTPRESATAWPSSTSNPVSLPFSS
jgi:hypothetical protein